MTPEELWRDGLIADLQACRPTIEKMMRYYAGDHDLPVVATSVKEQQQRKQAWAEFLRLMRISRANFMATIVDAVSERAEVTGFRMGDPVAAPELDKQNLVWSIWQQNHLDANSQLLIDDALICGAAYALIWPTATGVRITNEHATQCVVAYDPETRDRAAGLKSWTTGDSTFATLYLPDAVYKWIRPTDKPKGWTPRLVDGEPWPLTNPLGVVPLVEFSPRPQTLTGGLSELDGLIDTQDRINTTLFARCQATWAHGLQQRWAVGLPVDVDDDTGETRPLINTGADSLIYSEDPQTRFGQFDQVDLHQLIDAVQADLLTLSVQSKTPYQLLVSGGNVPNGESFKANTSGLVAKCRKRMTHLGEAFEEMARVALLAVGDPGAVDQATEVEWRNPEYRTEGETVDALVKMRSLGVPEEVLWRRWGASPQEVEQWARKRTLEQLVAPTVPAPVSSPFTPDAGD